MDPCSLGRSWQDQQQNVLRVDLQDASGIRARADYKPRPAKGRGCRRRRLQAKPVGE